jgi:hypothetical protein
MCKPVNPPPDNRELPVYHCVKDINSIMAAESSVYIINFSSFINALLS